MKKALILVDLQNDFLPGGALAVKNGDQVIPIVNQLLDKNFDYIVATKDYHPMNHGSFANTHKKTPGEHINLYGLDQILWPIHCVAGTKGAEFCSGWDQSCIEKVFYKGTDPTIDSYSTFFDNGHRKSTGLSDFLKEREVQDIFIAGLATDYCVKYSVLDALKLGYNVYVVKDACRAVNLNENDEQNAFEEMKKAGAHIIKSDQITL